MKKLLFLVLLFVGVLINPRLRAETAERLQPVAERLPLQSPHVSLIINPLFRWSANGELRGIARDLQRHQRTTGTLPSPARFGEHLRRTQLSGRSSMDPWGGQYYLQVSRDSVVVGSPGPDLLAETNDDLREGWPRF